MSTKIQINSLEALERLIGGDSELEIQIRNSVVQDFTKKHLKAVATSEFVSKMEEVLKEEVNLLITGERSAYLFKGVTLTPKALSLVQEATRATVTNLIVKAAVDTINRCEPVAKLNSIIDSFANDIASNVSEAILTRRIDELVDNKLKEKLGIK